MKLAAQFSFKGGLQEITGRYPMQFDEILEAIRTIDLKPAKSTARRRTPRPGQKFYHPAALNEAFRAELHPKGWKRVLIDCEVHSTDHPNVGNARRNLEGAFHEMEFVKDRLAIDLQLRPLPICSVCAKMTIFRNLDFIDCGIEIVPVKALALEMSSGVSYFEQFVWDLESRGVADIDIPVLILGVDA